MADVLSTLIEADALARHAGHRAMAGLFDLVDAPAAERVQAPLITLSLTRNLALTLTRTLTRALTLTPTLTLTRILTLTLTLTLIAHQPQS